MVYAVMKPPPAMDPAFAGMRDMSVQDVRYEIGDVPKERCSEIPAGLRSIVHHVIQATARQLKLVK